MQKHYHVTAGLRGGYIPTGDSVYETQRAAVSTARDLVAEYRDSGEKVRGGVYAASERGDLVGHWIARESESLPGTFWDYINVRICREPIADCQAQAEEWD